MTNAWQIPRGRGMGMLGIDWAISLTTSPYCYCQVYQYIRITATVLFLYCYEALLGRLHMCEFSNLSFHILRRKPCCCRYFSIVFGLFSVTVAVSTYLCVVCRHFCCPMLLFQGHVTWWNFTLTGPVLYLPYKNTDRHDKVKYPQSVYSGRGQGVRAFRFPPFPLLSPVPFPPLILPRFYLPIPLHYTSNPSHCSPNHLKEHDGQKSQTLCTIIVWGYRETAELSPRLIKSLS